VNVFIVSASGGQKAQFWANFDIWGCCSCTDPPLLMRVKFTVLEQTEGLHLPAKFHLNVFLVPASGGKKHNFGEIWHFLGAPVPTPFTDECQIWCAVADPRHTLTCQISSRSVYSVALWRRKTPIFAIFSTSAFSGVASWQQSEKVEHGCTATNLPLSNGIKIVPVLQRLHGEIGRTISDVQKRDRQTDRQTDKETQRFCPPRRWVKSEPHQTWHGDRGPRARSCTSKTFGV